MDIAQLLALWAHTLAFVIVLGYYGLLGRVMLPALARSLDGPAQTAALMAIERRVLPLVLLSVVVFIVTGTYLLVIDPNYAGLGHFFASTWSVLMLIKHGLVIVLIVLGVVIDFDIRGLDLVMSDSDRASVLRRVRLSAEAATGLGALVILLTVAAQLTT